MPIAWHAPYDKLKPQTQDSARAIQSLMEELEAVDWYGQRVDVTDDDALRRILEHNRDEEKEHASMLLEWIRRRDAKFDEKLRTYLFTKEISSTSRKKLTNTKNDSRSMRHRFH